MTRREAHVIGLRWAYEALQKAVDCGPGEDINGSAEDQAKCDAELDLICQMMFERWDRANARQKRAKS